MHLQGPLEDLVDDCLRQVEHLLLTFEPQQVWDLLGADIQTPVEEVVPNVFGCDSLTVRLVALTTE